MPRQHIPDRLRELIRERAGHKCEYCRTPESLAFIAFELDHVIAEQHGGSTTNETLALSRLTSNKRKGPNLASLDPTTGAITPLFNPRNQAWPDHFELTSDGRIVGRTPAGRATIPLLELNHSDRIEERRLFIAAGELVPNSH